jgi:hypothetical protein
MTTVVLAAPKVVDSPKVGGHFWEYMQYAHAFKELGCDVWWMECVSGAGDPKRGVEEALDLRLAIFMRNIRPFDLADRVLLYKVSGSPAVDEARFEPLNVTARRAGEIVRRADLLISFDYYLDAELVSLFGRTALVDIDPGLLQFWVHHGQLRLPAYDLYFTTGETVGTPDARFPDCGLPWTRVRPGVALDLWPYSADRPGNRFTTVSSWWGDEWITDGTGHYENNKRVTFLEYWDLPRRTGQAMELALFLGPGDAEDVTKLRAGGWTIRHSTDITRTPDDYRRYVRESRGEFSCVKPSCLRFRNAWISNRTLSYLASGKPAVVQDTGPSEILPSGEGLFRFSTVDEAAAAIAEVNANYERHSRAARELVEETFDATASVRSILDAALAGSPQSESASAQVP